MKLFHVNGGTPLREVEWHQEIEIERERVEMDDEETNSTIVHMNFLEMDSKRVPILKNKDVSSISGVLQIIDVTTDISRPRADVRILWIFTKTHISSIHLKFSYYVPPIYGSSVSIDEFTKLTSLLHKF